jgi:glycerate 2-kinase
MLIQNKAALLSHGNISGRQIVLDIIEAGISAADPYFSAKKLLRLDGDRLSVGHPDFSDPPGQGPQIFDLRKVDHIYVVGGGKAVQRQAKAFEEVLGDRITAGHINIKKGETVELSRIEVTLAGHPMPDKDSVHGAKRIVEILKSARKGDLVFWLQSGGGTALLALPAEGITLNDLLEVYRVLYFGAGASMPEANSVRNLIAILNMQETKYVSGATLFRFISTEIPLIGKTHAFGLSHPSNNAYERAVDVINKYQVWQKIPPSVREFLRKADPRYLPPTQEDITRRPYFVYRVNGPEDMLVAAENRAKELGLNSCIFATSLNDVDAQSAAEIFSEIAQESRLYGRPLKPPCAIILGGELTVAIGDANGVGGRNQEFALATAPRLAGDHGFVIASIDSDGTDGPTPVAGGIVDGLTMDRISATGIDLNAELRRHNSSPVLRSLGDEVVTGNTGANLRDLRVIYVEE